MCACFGLTGIDGSGRYDGLVDTGAAGEGES